MKSLHIIYASTSGHTEYAMEVLAERLRKRAKGIKISMERVEEATEKSFKRSKVVVMASGTWNTGGIEGQLNPHMHAFVHKTVADIDLKGKDVAVVGCGDDRYYYTCRAADYLERFVEDHGGTLYEPTLRLVNETYGQEKKIEKWADDLLAYFKNS